jgi:hypothetical protein
MQNTNLPIGATLRFIPFNHISLQEQEECMIRTSSSNSWAHTTYLDMYDRKDDSEKLKIYLDLEPEIIITYKGS